VQARRAPRILLVEVLLTMTTSPDGTRPDRTILETPLPVTPAPSGPDAGRHSVPGRLSTTDPATFWDELYAQRRSWGGRANPRLVETVEHLAPGRALDLGCGAGGDTLWLAERGWHVTAVDISATVVEKVAVVAESAGLADRVVAERHDLTQTFPAGAFDLVSAQYLQSPLPFARRDVFRRAAHALRPGGLLLVVDHGSAAPWSWDQDPDTVFTPPAEVLVELDLDPTTWVVRRADTPTREARGPGGQTAVVTDNVLLVERTGGSAEVSEATG
jgi:SAM-dependent methyltransferase